MPRTIQSSPTHRSSYSSSAISKRTGLSKSEISELRKEVWDDVSDPPKREQSIGGLKTEESNSKSRPGIDLKKDRNPVRESSWVDSPFSIEVDAEGGWKVAGSLDVGVGSVSFGVSNEGEVEGGVEALGVGFVTKEGKYKISLPGGIKVINVEKGCYIVSVFTIFDQYVYSNINKKPGCEDDNGGDEGTGGSSGKGAADSDFPPHCTNPATGKRGTGDSVGLFPECLRGTGKVVSFRAVIVAGYTHSGKNPDGSTIEVKNIGKVSGFDLEKDEYMRGNFYSVTRQDGEEQIITDSSRKTSIINGDKAYTIPFKGTLEGLEEFLSKKDYFPYGESIPGGRDESTSDGGNIGPEHYQSIQYKSYVYPVVFTLDPEYSHCNPTGDEGCDVKGSSDSSDKDKPGFPTSGGSGGEGNNGGGRPQADRGDKVKDCCKLVKKIAKTVGVDRLPAKVPDNYLTDDNKVKEIPSIPDFLDYIWVHIYEHFGQFPIKFEIEDTDPLTPGNQSETTPLQNVAESLAEIYGLVYSVLNQQQIVTDLCYRTLLTAGLNRESGVRNEELTEAVIDYLGVETETQKREISQLFTLGKEEWDEILKESDSEVETVELKNQKQNLQAQLAEFGQVASIIRARYWKQVDPRGDVKSQLLNQLRDGINLAENVQNLIGGDKEGDWDNFLKWVKEKNKAEGHDSIFK